MRIASISSSRADVGILRPVWRALVARGVEVHLVLTGMHAAVDASPPDVSGLAARTYRVGSDLGGRADASATSAMADILAACGKIYAEVAPDWVLAVGDRLDMLPAVVAALPFNIPIAHLHGGEITEGAIDDRIRNAITQLSSLHLASCETAAERLRAMSVDPSCIVVTGAPGLDTLVEAPVLDRTEFLRDSGLIRIDGADKSFVLATVHPETNSIDPQAPMRAVLGALDVLKVPVLFTAPNSDPGGREMRATLEAWIAERSFAMFVDTLGPRLYPNALRHAAAMVGNSSSGIIEAGLLGLPVVDIGDRQKGRTKGENVQSVASYSNMIALQIQKALSFPSRLQKSIYGDGDSAPLVAAALLKAAPRTVQSLKRLEQG